MARLLMQTEKNCSRVEPLAPQRFQGITAISVTVTMRQLWISALINREDSMMMEKKHAPVTTHIWKHWTANMEICKQPKTKQTSPCMWY